jgi:SnoaL-like domain
LQHRRSADDQIRRVVISSGWIEDTATTMMQATAQRFINALKSRAWDDLATCFHEQVRFNALIPPGLRTATDASAATNYLKQWFGDADQLELLSSSVKTIEDRVHIAYRFRAHEDRWYVVEQHVFCTVRDGHIDRMDLLCSGFRPDSTAGQPA